MQKVVLILIDGMRPDGFLQCGNPFINEIMEKSTYTLTGTTVYPSLTLPCHMSLFHSVPTDVHGVKSNLYVAPEKPINGLFDQIKLFGGKCAMYYGWETLRDLGRPKALQYSSYVEFDDEEGTDMILTELAVDRIKKSSPDFVFIYLVEVDDKGGHNVAWMSDTYLYYVNKAIDCVKKVYEEAGDEYTVILTADHGGHDDNHGTDMPVDMTIPIFFKGKDFEPGKKIDGVNIMDIAPTIVDIMGISPAPEWEGKSILKK
ncbi:MAG: hypothetical protein E7218_03590 [Anaerofustis stercorihominis]|nr:hypothetical protein [Anaerofustis stercorihominis]